MIAFKYKTIEDVEWAHFLLKRMDIPGETIEEPMDDEGKAVVVWQGDKFIAIFHPKEQTLVLYGTKATNSVNFYIMRYPLLEWDTWHLIKTKRWG